MLLLVTQGIILFALFNLGWRILRRILRRLVVKTDIDNLPGPLSQSFTKGEYSIVLCTSPTWSIYLARKSPADIQRRCLGLSQGARAKVYVVYSV